MQFYSYLWLRDDQTPFYAGKGQGNRAYKAHHNGGRVLYPPKDKSRILVFSTLNEAEAFESEVALIELFGRKDNGTGCLRNLTDGGENPPNHRGKKRSEETLRKMRAAQQGHPGNVGSRRSEATKTKMRLAQLGKKHSPDAINRMRIAHAHITQDTKDKIRAALRGRPSYPRTPETKQKMSTAGKLSWVTRKTTAFGVPSTETKKKMSAALMGHEVSVETRRKISLKVKGQKRSPEVCARIAASHEGLPWSAKRRAVFEARKAATCQPSI